MKTRTNTLIDRMLYRDYGAYSAHFGYRVVNGELTEEPCFTVCGKKLSEEELDTKKIKRIPDELTLKVLDHGLVTLKTDFLDVSGAKFLNKANGGIPENGMVITTDFRSVGTMGMFLRWENKVYGLTNKHVTGNDVNVYDARNKKLIGRVVKSDGMIAQIEKDRSNIILRWFSDAYKRNSRTLNQFDYALVEMLVDVPEDRLTSLLQNPKIGDVLEGDTWQSRGKHLVKVVSVGTVPVQDHDGVTYWMEDQEIVYIQGTNYGQSGDSGSVLFNPEDRSANILFAWSNGIIGGGNDIEETIRAALGHWY